MSLLDDLMQNATLAASKINGLRKMITGSISDEEAHNIIPLGTTRIADFAFFGKVMGFPIIPNSVTEIGVQAFGRFNYIDSTTSKGYNARIPGNVATIEHDAFIQSTGLKNLYIENGVTDIYNSAFALCSNLEKVYLPLSINSIGSNAFSNCTKLKNIYYTGTETQWNNIIKGSYAFPSGVTIHYEYVPD